MNFYTSNQTYNVGDEGFMYAIRLRNNQFNETQIAAYFSYYNYNGSVLNKIFIPAEICTESHFPSSMTNQLYALSVIGGYL